MSHQAEGFCMAAYDGSVEYQGPNTSKKIGMLTQALFACCVMIKFWKREIIYFLSVHLPSTVGLLLICTGIARFLLHNALMLLLVSLQGHVLWKWLFALLGTFGKSVMISSLRTRSHLLIAGKFVFKMTSFFIAIGLRQPLFNLLLTGCLVFLYSFMLCSYHFYPP